MNRAAGKGFGTAMIMGRPHAPSVLVAVGGLAEFGRLRDVVFAVGADADVTVRWSAVGGAPAVEQALRAAGVATVPWSRADGFDLVLACHTTGEVPGLVVTITDADDIPVAVGVSTEDDRAAAEASIPGAAGRTFVMGDPTWARVLAVADRRAEFRQVLGVPDNVALVALGCARPDAVALVLSRLPYDEYRVATLVPGGDVGVGGLIAVSPESDWIAALIAADVVIGDPGPVLRYARGLGRTVLPSTVVDEDVLSAVLATESTVESMPAVSPGSARDRIRGLLGLPIATSPVALRPFGPLLSVARPATAFLLSTVESSGVISVTRVPHAPGRRTHEDILVVDQSDPDPALLANAEIVTHTRTDSPAAWVESTITQSHSALAAARSPEGHAHYTWYTGETWTTAPHPFPLVPIAAALYHHLVEHDTTPHSITLPLRLGPRVEQLTFTPIAPQ
ncbi:hypothetical protein Aglo03_21380 [Actinokineospora globicatena]|uniref:Uncharacterized protein n=2 Tax=Actinokineospora globicatena TaxID=103729 RepID=A0A9W6V7F8_9PSEU|nr:hypothetical protein Aglo03_21380 [Actinokineospora globicatena]